MINSIVARALANKKAKGFPCYDINGDIELIKKELIEVQEASYDERAHELADVIILCCGIAGYSAIDLEKALLEKMEIVEKRKITKLPDGSFAKE